MAYETSSSYFISHKFCLYHSAHKASHFSRKNIPHSIHIIKNSIFVIGHSYYVSIQIRINGEKQVKL